MDELLYWLIEYGKVLFGYGFLMFVWPMVVFRKYLAGKSVTFRFSFCATMQIVLINTVVLLLGLLHILNAWTVRILFYGVFIWSIRECCWLTPERKRKIKYLFNGTFGWKNFIWLKWRKTMRTIEEFCKKVWRFYKRHWLEYTLLIVAVMYGMLYFSWGAFQDHSYGFGDMYVHHSWIYELTKGNIFSAGVYPEAMHCVVYSIHTLFGIDIYSCMLFLAGIHIAIILVAAYCFMKELFHWRFSAILVLILFLTVDVVCVDEVFSMSRLQWTLPQEYGFHTMYLCALYLFKYLLSEKTGSFRKRAAKGYWNEELLIFMLALAASIVIHFYVTIMAFFLCVAVAMFSLKRIFTKKRFIPLVAGAVLGVVIAVVPMIGALASGIPFQGSIGWAVNVINGTDTGEGRTQSAQSQVDKENETQTEDTAQGGNIQQSTDGQEGIQDSDNSTGPVVKNEPSVLSKIVGRISSIVSKITGTIKDKFGRIYSKGYVTLYKGERSLLIVIFTCTMAAICFMYMAASFFWVKVLRRDRKASRYALEYPIVIMASFLFMVLYAAPYIGLPELIAGARLCSTEQMLIIMVFVIPVDIICTWLGRRFSAVVMRNLGAVMAVVFIAVIYITGNYHGYMYFELTRYNAAVYVTNKIIEELPQNTYTIVSTTDETYQVIQYGRHEELLTFLGKKENEDEKYTLPTEYVFLFVEKKPVKYAHNHFFSGPEWLAKEKYQDYYTEKSVCPEVSHAVISEEAAEKDIMYFPSKPSRSYSELESRTILESRLYKWCEEFEEAYPYEMNVYYEDEDFVCYYFRQNVQSLYNLELK